MRGGGTKAALLIAVLAVTLASCGVKSALVRPDGQSTPKTDKDPSQPPYPLGR